MNEMKKAIQSIHYLLSKLGKTDKLKIIKLLFLVDKYHLLWFGRTTTRDDYYAMEFGPVGSNVLSAFDLDDEYAKEFIEQVNRTKFKIKQTLDKYKSLSKTDIKALNYIIEKFGKMSTSKLVDYTHKYPEWKQHEENLNKKKIKREKIKFNELFTQIGNEFGLTLKDIDVSKDIYLNY